MTTPLRRTIEQHSAPVLFALRRMPGWMPFLGLLALVLGGLFAPPLLGAALLVLVGLAIGWLVYLGWPALPPAGRAVRVAVLAIVLVAAVRRMVAG